MAKSRRKSRHSRRSYRRRRSGGRSSKSMEKKKKKIFTRIDKNCKDLGGEFKAHYPSQAAPKVAKKLFKQSDNGKSVRIYFRQKTPGPGHNDTYAFDVQQVLIPATKWDIDNRDYKTGDKKAIRKAKFIAHVSAEDNCKGLP